MAVSFLIRHSRLSLILSILVAISFCSFALFVQTVNNVDSFRLQDHPDQEYYEQFQEVFGNHEFFVIAFEKEDIFTPENLRLLKDITTDLEGLDLARDVLSLANADNIIGEEQYFYVQSFLDDIPQSSSELNRLREQAIHNPLYQKNLISADGTTAAIVVFAHDRPDDPDYRQKLIRQTHKVLEPYAQDTDFYLAGWTITNYSLSQYVQKDMGIFLPVTFLLIAFVSYLFFRNVRLTFLALVVIAASVGSTMGLAGILDIPLNNVTVIVPPLVMALTLAAIVHIFTHMERSILDHSPDRKQALSEVLQLVILPCSLTTVTTAAGFLSLFISELEPVRQFSLLASAGMVFGFFFCFFMLPPLLLMFDPRRVYFQARDRQVLNRFLSGLYSLVRKHQHKIAALGGILAVLALIFAGQIKVETNVIKFFKKSSPERQALDFVQQRLSGVGLLDVSVQGNELDTFKDPDNLMVIERLESYLNEIPGVDTTTSFNHFIKDMHKSFHNEDPEYYKIPGSRQLIAQYLLLYDADDIDDFVNSDFDHSRIMVRLGVHSSSEQSRIIDAVDSYFEQIEAPGLSMRVTGQAVQDVNIIDALVSGQITSLSIAVGVISLLMFVVFKSMSLGLLCLIPNIFPILINFAIMGLLGIPLNTATSLIAAVAIGIAVDDTIHFLSYYNAKRKQGVTASEAVESTVLIKGRALVSTSMILCAAFGVLLLSSFVPIIYFGLLSALIMITALIGDLVLLPAILMHKPSQAGAGTA